MWIRISFVFALSVFIFGCVSLVHKSKVTQTLSSFKEESQLYCHFKSSETPKYQKHISEHSKNPYLALSALEVKNRKRHYTYEFAGVEIKSDLQAS